MTRKERWEAIRNRFETNGLDILVADGDGSQWVRKEDFNFLLSLMGIKPFESQMVEGKSQEIH